MTLYEEKPKKKKTPLPWWKRPMTVAMAATALVLLAMGRWMLTPPPDVPAPTPTWTLPPQVAMVAEPYSPVALTASEGRIVHAEVSHNRVRWRTITVDPYSQPTQVLSVVQQGELFAEDMLGSTVDRVEVAADASAFLTCDAAGCLLHTPQGTSERLIHHATLLDNGALFAANAGELVTLNADPIDYRIPSPRPFDHLVLNATRDYVAGASARAYFAGSLDKPAATWIETDEPIYDITFTLSNELAVLMQSRLDIYDLEGGQRSYALDPLHGEPVSLAVSEDSAYMAVVQRGAVTVWPLAVSEPLRPEAASSPHLLQASTSPMAAAFVPGTRLVLVAYPHGRLLAFDLDSARVAAEIQHWQG